MIARKSDATDAHSVALVATRMTGLRRVGDDQQLAVLRILADRRRSLGEDHARFPDRAHFASWNGTAPIDGWPPTPPRRLRRVRAGTRG